MAGRGRGGMGRRMGRRGRVVACLELFSVN